MEGDGIEGATAASPRLKPLERKRPGELLVHEVYRSIQGEGTHAGLPCAFVRLTTCHLRCGYCDTPHAFTLGESRPLDDVVREVLALGDRLVQVTGGEPLLQEEAFELIARLADRDRLVLVESSGAVDTSRVDPRARLILDVKTPGSGEVEANVWSNLDRLRIGDEVKFVVCDRADFDWSVGVLRRYRLLEVVPVLVAPSYGAVEPADLAAWILETGLPLRIQVQLHKLLWGAERRGV
jgi:7-carboxy-7-deazaguanine synthase